MPKRVIPVNNFRMPIYEFACPKCRVVFNFLSKRMNPDRLPACPKCGNQRMLKQMSRFAMTKGLKDSAPGAGGADDRAEAEVDHRRGVAERTVLALRVPEPTRQEDTAVVVVHGGVPGED